MNYLRIAGKILTYIGGILLVLVMLAGSYKLMKTLSRKANLGLWPKEPSLESIDPSERIDAAREAARIYGGRT